jgi:predicted amidophosphoribosyltransferase
MGTLAAFLDLVLPRRCAVCSAAGSELCSPCRSGFERLAGPRCLRCGKPAQWAVVRCVECAGRRLAFASARGAVVYDEAVRAFVRAWKERGLRRLSSQAAELVTEVVERPSAQAIAFVPADRERSLRRGHHPAERLARELGVCWQLPVGPLLARTRSVPRQAGLPLAERRRNVAGAFAPVGRSPPRVVLVDDVYTSGATVSSAASALRRAGARRVDAVTFARAVR